MTRRPNAEFYLAIVAFLSAIAYPSFQKSLYKGRRPDAMVALATMQLAEERFRGSNTAYQATLSGLTGATSTTSPSGYYTLSIVAAGATSYTLQATASASGKQANDTDCQLFQVQLTSGVVTYTSSNNGGANGSPDPCWVK